MDNPSSKKTNISRRTNGESVGTGSPADSPRSKRTSDARTPPFSFNDFEDQSPSNFSNIDDEDLVFDFENELGRTGAKPPFSPSNREDIVESPHITREKISKRLHEFTPTVEGQISTQNSKKISDSKQRSDVRKKITPNSPVASPSSVKKVENKPKK